MAFTKNDPFKRVNELAAKGIVPPKSAIIVDSIANPNTGLGGYADPGKASRPTLGEDRLTLEEIEWLYAQTSIVRRACDDLVVGALSAGWKVNSQLAAKWWKEAARGLSSFTHEQIATVVTEAAKNARRTGVGGLILVPQSDEIDLSRSLEDQLGVEPGPVVNLVPFDRWELQVSEFDNNIRSPSYQKGLVFDYSPHGTVTADDIAGKLHRDHLIFFPGEPLPKQIASVNDFFDDSAVQGFWGACRNFLDTTNAMASIVQSFEVDVMSIAGLAHMEVSASSKALRDRLELIGATKSLLQMIALDADSGEKYERTFATVSGLDVIWDKVTAAFVAAVGSTMTRIFGLSPGGMSGDDQPGRALIRQKTADYQVNHLLEPLTRVYRGLLGDRSLELDIEFMPSEPISTSEQANVRESESRALTSLKMAKIIDERAALIELERSGSISPAAAAASRLAWEQAPVAGVAPVDEFGEPVEPPADQDELGEGEMAGPPGASDTPTGTFGTTNLNPTNAPGNPEQTGLGLENDL